MFTCTTTFTITLRASSIVFLSRLLGILRCGGRPQIKHRSRSRQDQHYRIVTGVFVAGIGGRRGSFFPGKVKGRGAQKEPGYGLFDLDGLEFGILLGAVGTSWSCLLYAVTRRETASQLSSLPFNILARSGTGMGDSFRHSARGCSRGRI